MKTINSKILLGFICAFSSLSNATTNTVEVDTMPTIIIEGLGSNQRIMVFAVNSRAPVISNRAMSYVRWVNGNSLPVVSTRGQATIASFDYVVSNANVIQFKTNNLIIVEFSETVKAPYYLNRHITDDSCPQTPRFETLNYKVNDGCVGGVMSPLMNAVVRSIPISRIQNDPNAETGSPVILKKGRDF